MKKIILISILNLILLNVLGQNLVPNGDFEQYNPCPSGTGQFTCSIWTNPTSASPDYFNACDPGVVNVPNSLYGFQYAHSDSGRSGIVIYSGNAVDYREYVQVQLTQSLTASQCYYFEMYISLADNFKFESDAAGVYFSATSVSQGTSMNLPYTPQITNTTGTFDSSSWRQVSGIYLATGGENYIVIGNFKDNATTNFNLYNSIGTYNYAYIYIDDVFLTPCTGIEKQNQITEIKIYPNPVKDELFVYCHSLYGKKHVVVTDILGKEIYRNQFHPDNYRDDFRLLTSGFQSGIYFVEISDGKNILRKKFLKK